MRNVGMDVNSQLLADLPTLYTRCPFLVQGNLISTLMMHPKPQATPGFCCGYTPNKSMS